MSQLCRHAQDSGVQTAAGYGHAFPAPRFETLRLRGLVSADLQANVQTFAIESTCGYWSLAHCISRRILGKFQWGSSRGDAQILVRQMCRNAALGALTSTLILA